MCRDFGPGTAASKLIRRALRLLGSDHPGHAKWLARKAEVDHRFDQEHGTKTGGIQEIFELTIVGDNARHGLSHIASDPGEFASLISTLKVDLSTFTFIDLGSGKGRAVILAARYPFQRIIGVEFARELVAAAKANVEALATHSVTDRRVEFICGDASAYPFPESPLIVYLFNPFGSTIIRRVAENLIESWRHKPRPILVLYANPVHLDEFLKSGWTINARSEAGTSLVPEP